MKILIILLSLTFIFSKVHKDFKFQFQSDSEGKSDNYIQYLTKLYYSMRFPFFQLIKNLAQVELDSVTNETEWKNLRIKQLGYGLIEEKCKYYIMNNTFSDYDLFLNKLYNSLIYSSKQLNDLGGYKKCLSFDSKKELKNFNKSLDTKMEYVIIIIDKSNTRVLGYSNERKKYEVNSTKIFTHYHLNTYCLPNNRNFCNETSLEIIYGGVHEYIKGYIRENEIQNFKVYIFNNDTMKYKFNLPEFIPFIILLLHLLISLTGEFSKKLTRYKIFQFFNLEENMEECFNINLAITKYNNFKGLTYINCLIGISMIFMIFGSVFLLMINLPIISYEYQSLYLLMKNFFYSIFFIGIRYSPRILISCSGFTLSFKFISYLNDNKSYLRFLFYQIHKYFFLIIVILFYYYSLYYLKQEISASWYYFHRTSIKNVDEIRAYLYLLPIYHFSKDRNEDQFFLNQNFIDYLWLPYNEIILFLFGSLIIFICYKFNWRLDLICIIGFFVLIVSKLIYFNYFVNNIYSTLYFYYFNYGKYMTNPIFNLSYFLIGIFFGLINYCIENDLYIIDEKSNLKEKNTKLNENKKTRYTHDLEGKSYLKIPCYIFHIIKKSKKINKYIGIFILILLLIPSLLQFFYLFFLEIKEIDEKKNKNYIDYFINNNIIKIIYNFDIEVIVLIIYLLIFLYIKSFFLVKSFFNLEIWRFFGKIYFTFTVCINLVILCIFYSDNKKISLKFETIFLYSIINVISIIIISILAYLFFELPYKKLIKNYYKESNLNNSQIINNSNEIENDEEEEESDYDN